MGIVGIDVAALAAPATPGHREEVARLRAVAAGAGAFGVDGHGLDPALVDDTFGLVRAWFDLPLDHKRRHLAAGSPEGYHPRPAAGDQREKFLRLRRREPPASRPWPEAPPALASRMDALSDALEPVALTLLGGLAQALGLPAAALRGPFEARGDRAVWMLHYPAVEPAGGRPGQGTSAHADFLPLALILQDPVGGLELRDEEDRWHAVDARRWPLVAQLGDLSARWSNDLLRANVHRVRNDATRARFSILYAPVPPDDQLVAPLPGCVTPERPARYPPAPFGDCLRAWSADLEAGRAGHRAD